MRASLFVSPEVRASPPRHRRQPRRRPGVLGEFPKIRGRSLWGPYNKVRYYIRVPYYRKLPIQQNARGVVFHVNHVPGFYGRVFGRVGDESLRGLFEVRIPFVVNPKP